MKKVNEFYNSWLTGDGVFTDLNAYDVPWKVEDATENAKIVASLNFAYHGNHSGDKNVSPVVNKFIRDEVATPRAKLADTLFIMYGDKWARLWDAMHAEYNPIENYDLHELETPAEITHTITPAETTTTETPAEITRTLTPAETTTTETPAETTRTLTPAETTTTETPAETTRTITPAETTTTETPAETTRTLTPAETTTTETPAETTRTVTPAETTTTETPAETTKTITPAETTETVKPAKTTVENGVSAFNSSGYTDDTISTTTGDVNDKGTNSLSVDTAGSEKNETDTAGNTKIEVDTAGSDKLAVDTAGSTKIEVDTAGNEKLEVDTAGNTKIEVDAAGTDVLTVQNERELYRHGNIGIQSATDLLKREIDLRQWNYFNGVFNDIDTLLTLSIY